MNFLQRDFKMKYVHVNLTSLLIQKIIISKELDNYVFVKEEEKIVKLNKQGRGWGSRAVWNFSKKSSDNGASKSMPLQHFFFMTVGGRHLACWLVHGQGMKSGDKKHCALNSTSKGTGRVLLIAI